VSDHDRDASGIGARGEELLEVMRRGQRFTEALVGENERLRLEAVRTEADAVRRENELLARVSALTLENEQLRASHTRIDRRLEEVQAENHEFASRYVEIGRENESLANLYVASYRLHSTLDPDDVSGIISEIMIELVGAEEFGLLLIDERTSELTPIIVEGSLQDYPAHILVGEGPIGRTVREGKAYYAPEYRRGSPFAILPLQIKGHAVGAIVVMKMLHGRTDLDIIARELLGLVAAHSATALTSARLYSAVDRKLKTIEAFVALRHEPVRTPAHGTRP
jgi:hypothetical protein